jgi:predicted nucleic acid-binding Zn ribbon protein
MTRNPGKWCCSCQQWLPPEAFAPKPELRSGFDSWCRSCHAERTRQWREANPEYLAEYNERRRSEYRAEHPRTSRPCVVCGQPHSRQAEALVCSERCPNRRKREQRRRAKAEAIERKIERRRASSEASLQLSS